MNKIPSARDPDQPSAKGGETLSSETEVNASLSQLRKDLDSLNQKYVQEHSHDAFRLYMIAMISAGAGLFVIVFIISYFFVTEDASFSMPFSTNGESEAAFAEKFEFSLIFGISSAAAAALAFVAMGSSAVQQQNDKLSGLNLRMDHIREQIATIELDEAARRRHKRLGVPYTFSPLYLRIRIYIEDQRFDEALDVIKSELNKAPSDSMLRIFEGIALGKIGENENALKAFEKAIELDPSNPDAWYNKAIVLLQMGRMEDAIDSLNRAIRLNPIDTMAHGHLLRIISQLRPPSQEFLKRQFRLPEI